MAIAFVTTELFLTFAIPACEFPFLMTETTRNIKVYDRVSSPAGHYAKGQFSEIQADWSVNNDGWIADIDYLDYGKRLEPAIAILGDSYVEALMIDWKGHLAARLRELLHDQYAVYAMGMSGATLSHYVNVARLAAEKYDPEILIILYNPRDLLGSVTNYSRDELILQYRYDGGREFTEIPAGVYSPNPIRRLLRKSALVRYITWNRNIDIFGGGNREAARVTADEERKRSVAEIERDRVLTLAAEHVVGIMKAEHPSRRIIFVSDGDREAIYEGKTEFPVPEAGRMIESACAEFGCEHYRLVDVFYQDYRQHMRAFNFDIDYHWNEYGHSVIAGALYEFLRSKDVRQTP